MDAFAKLFMASKNASYLKVAERTAMTILEHMMQEDRLMHLKNSEIGGFLDDYAFVIFGLMELYHASLDALYLEKAVLLQKKMLKLFGDADGGLFFSSFTAEQMITRKKEVYDGAIPSGNSVALVNLVRLSRLTGDQSLEHAANEMIKFFSSEVLEYPRHHAMFMIGLDLFWNGSSEVVIVGQEDAQGMINTLHEKFLPFTVWVLRSSSAEKVLPWISEYVMTNKKATAYVCKRRTCKLPVNHPLDMLELLK